MKKIVAAFVFAIASMSFGCSETGPDFSLDFIRLNVCYTDNDCASLLTAKPELRCQFDVHGDESDKWGGPGFFWDKSGALNIDKYLDFDEYINDKIDYIESLVVVDLPEEFGEPQRDTIRIKLKRQKTLTKPEEYVLVEAKYNDQIMNFHDKSATIDVVR